MSSVNGASAIVIATEWDEFLKYDLDKIKKVMKSPATIYDFRCYMNGDLLA
jgi:UDP-glucose 6-dehydrogenase